MFHGGANRSAALTAAESLLVERKIQHYRESCFKFRKLRTGKSYDKSSLKHTQSILEENADFYSVWNFRREIFLTFVHEKESDLSKLLENELKWLFVVVLPANPKCYAVWNYRIWCLQLLSDLSSSSSPWVSELAILDKTMGDSRNFHWFSYRRKILQKVQTEDVLFQELQITSKLIHSSVTNNSAWQHRRYIFSTLRFQTGTAQLLSEELHLVHNAMFTEPGNESIWYYYDWLLGNMNCSHAILENEVSLLEELVVLEPNVKWAWIAVLQLQKQIKGVNLKRSLCSIEHLQVIDSDRKEYYNSFRY